MTLSRTGTGRRCLPTSARAAVRMSPDRAREFRHRHETQAAWLERKKAYMAAVAHKQPDELRVSLADNARAIVLEYRTHDDKLWDRFSPRPDHMVR